MSSSFNETWLILNVDYELYYILQNVKFQKKKKYPPLVHCMLHIAYNNYNKEIKEYLGLTF